MISVNVKIFINTMLIVLLLNSAIVLSLYISTMLGYDVDRIATDQHNCFIQKTDAGLLQM